MIIQCCSIRLKGAETLFLKQLSLNPRPAGVWLVTRPAGGGGGGAKGPPEIS